MISTIKTNATTAKVIKPKILDRFAKTFCSGVISSASLLNPSAILPISVFIPVLATTPIPLP